MKFLKKFASIALALVMVLALAAPAFAANNTTITVPNNNRNYDIFQIFTGDLSTNEAGAEVLSNIKWGQNGMGTVGEAVPETVLNDLKSVIGQADTAELNVIQKYVNLSGTPFDTIAANSTTRSVSVPTGYYLIRDNGPAGEGESLSLYVVEIVGPTSITPKTGTTTVEKKIVEDGTKVDANEASIGDTINYEIVGTLPDNYDLYETYKYTFTDTLSAGLTFSNDVKVMVGDIDVTSQFNISHSSDSSANGVTTIVINNNNLKALTGVTLTKDSKVTVTYTAVLNDKAQIGGGTGNKNDVKLSYSNDPNHSGAGDVDHPTGETPPDEVFTFTTELEITKTDETGKILTGAGFTLTGDGVNVVLKKSETFTEAENGTYYKLKNGTYTTTAPTEATTDDYDSTTVKYSKTTEYTKYDDVTNHSIAVMVDSNGKATFAGLGEGHYTLSETTTPSGYNTIGDIEFDIEFDESTKTFSVKNVTGVAPDAIVVADNILSTTIVNQSGTTLPETGGIGTTIFYIVGGVLLIGAVVLLIAKRRTSADED